MGNLGEYLAARAEAQGRAKGMAKGIYLLMSHSNMTFDEAVLKFGLSPDEAETYRPYVEAFSPQNDGNVNSNPKEDESGKQNKEKEETV